MKHLECPIRQTAVTHVLGADAQRETTGPVKKKKNQHRKFEDELLLNHFEEKSSSSDKQKKKANFFALHDEQQHPWSCLKTVARTLRDFLLPTFDIIFHFAGNCWECCPSTLF